MPTTIHNTGITFPDATTQTTAASAGGQVQTQIFTAPGTWTKPASCTQVKVTVIGGGGGGTGAGEPSPGGTGGTSSFGPAVSATGGSGAPNGTPAVNGNPGGGTVSIGTALRTSSTNSTVHYSVDGAPQSPTGPAVTYSPSSSSKAGGIGIGPGPRNGGAGGLAIAIVPVSAPVSITVGGAGAVGWVPVSSGGVSGAVVVEFVG